MINALKKDETLIGFLTRFEGTGVLEAFCSVDWDFVWIDGQHGQFNFNSLLLAVQLLDAWGISSILRVPSDEVCILGPYADLAPDAIMIPMVESAKQAEHIVQALRFPPQGDRSFGGIRVLLERTGGMKQAKKLVVIPQIETPKGIENAEEILSVKGIDGVFLGALDIKLRIGIDMSLDVTNSPELRKIAADIASIARSKGKFAGAIANTPAVMKLLTKLGYRLINIAVDTNLIRQAASDAYTKCNGNKKRNIEKY